MLKPQDKKALDEYKALCKYIYEVTEPARETEQEKRARLARMKTDYRYFVEYYFSHLDDFSECGDFHIAAANKIKKAHRIKAVMKWARGHAKSTHFNLLIPLWLKMQGELKVMVSVGKNETDASGKLSMLQAQLENNRKYIADFGEQKSQGSWEEGEFVTNDGVAFFARGRGQSPRGLIYNQQRPDYVVVDDIDDDELSNNEKRVDDLVDWTLQALLPAVNIKKFRFIIVGNLFSENSVLQKVSERPGTFVSQVNAVDAKGNPTWHQRYTKEELEEIEEFIGWVRFQREYMNNPIKLGKIWKPDHFRYKKLPPLHKYDYLVVYFDPSWKGKRTSNHKAIKFWGKIGNELHCVKSFLRQCEISEAVAWVYDLHESLPENVIVDYYMEAIFMQDTLLDEFTTEGSKRGYQLPIRGDYRKKPDKFQRVEAMHPYWVRGFVWYNQDEQNDPDMKKSREQLLAFGPGSRADDDGPDADEGAIFLLQKKGRISESVPLIGVRPSPRNKY